MTELASLEAMVGFTFTDYQVEALDACAQLPGPRQRVCLYYKTGAGKSVTALAALAQWGYTQAVVVAPPSTHASWAKYGEQLKMQLTLMSHAKFRMKDTKLSRDVPVVADEIHMFGGHGGKGWTKLDRLAGGLQAPMVLASATPNYNDAERVYCIQHILDRQSCTGGFLAFVQQNCVTTPNPFGMIPNVTGFLRYADAAEYLASLPGVFYLPDELVYSIVDIPVQIDLGPAFEQYNYDGRKHRIMASDMEIRHTAVYQRLVDTDGLIRDTVFLLLKRQLIASKGPVLIFCNHSTVAEALGRSLAADEATHAVVTGSTPKKKKEEILARFKTGRLPILVGTTTLATGTDGFDKVCDTLYIFDDTDDDALRRQLIGRIMPRGLDTDTSKKRVFRLEL